MQDKQSNERKNNETKEIIFVYYDGECRFCKHYAKYIWLFKKYDFQLRNAREYLAEMKEYHMRGIDINTGMIVEHNHETYHGAAGVIFLNDLVVTGTAFATTKKSNVTWLYQSVYWIVNKMRLLFLWFKKVKEIR